MAAKRISTCAVGRVLRSRAQPLPELHAGCLRAVAAGAVWPQGRLADAGYGVDEKCRLCRQFRDSLWHRWWQCPHTSHLRNDEAIVPQSILKRAVAAGEGNVLYERALVPHPAEVLPPPAEEAAVTWWQDDSIGAHSPHVFDGEVFVDGSCSTHAIAARRRAAWAAVEVDPETGQVLRKISGAVPRAFCQTPQVAEFLAVQFVAPSLRLGAQIASDCANVVKHFGLSAAAQLQRGRPFAGISRELRRIAGPGVEIIRNIRKVPAHVEVEACTTDAAKRDARGNKAADLAAKHALLLHAQASNAVNAELNAQWQDAVATARLAAAAGHLWPAAKPPEGRRLPKRLVATIGCANAPPAVLRARQANRRAATHRWAEHRGVMRCSICWALRSRTGVAATQDCPGLSARHLGIASHAPRLGHDLWCAEVIRPGNRVSPLLICMECGAFSESGHHVALRSSQCVGPTSKHGWAQIQRVRQGKHPRTGPVGAGASLCGLQRVPPVATGD